MGNNGSEEDFSLFVVASDITVDAHAFGIGNIENEEDGEEWHDCDPSLTPLMPEDDDDFSDLEQLQVLELQGKDKAGRKILRIVGKFFPAKVNQAFHLTEDPLLLFRVHFDCFYLIRAPVISGERLKRYVYQKIFNSVAEEPFCILYIHTSVQKEENSPGVSMLRWIYEELPSDYKERLQVVYFLHPGIRSRMLLATLGRYFLSGGLYWKLKYVNRLEFLWDDIKKREIKIPEFVVEHDAMLENRPLMDYGIETDPYHLYDMPHAGSAYPRPAMRWA